jgi:23S rRNA (adenine2503-C2)-methyltransferase
MMTPTRYDLSRDQLGEVLHSEPRYRLDQLWDGLYTQLADPVDITNLPKSLRSRLDLELPNALTAVTESTSDDGDTVKFLWELEGASRVETVLMLYRDRATVCVSSQAGCAMACGFCATGQAGFTRQLTVGEIVEQVVRASRRARAVDRRVSNIVFMGMGEPLANEPAVWASIERCTERSGLSARHLTDERRWASSPGSARWPQRPLPVNLAVSAARGERHPARRARTDQPPLPARRSDGCLRRLPRRQRGDGGQFEWAMIDGVNDRDSDARRVGQHFGDACASLRTST